MYGVCQSASQLANVNVVCARTCAGKFANRRIRVTGNDFPSSPVYYYPAAEARSPPCAGSADQVCEMPERERSGGIHQAWKG